ncbi:hypothetical protein BDF20DRAFT_78237 [Mycotypha africana]|uniref:uncharacterized protein n=1 Tax=Mycotypha africana TaxID=64632 RepID=UPI002300F560|nr:uncharacterized protein BDF20DRAFT_78237 [Mycotypha africana]KAI8991955.1 hypothetical protein BDF20DRAFT_78237 [Mycotypha africana]
MTPFQFCLKYITVQFKDVIVDSPETNLSLHLDYVHLYMKLLIVPSTEAMTQPHQQLQDDQSMTAMAAINFNVGPIVLANNEDVYNSEVNSNDNVLFKVTYETLLTIRKKIFLCKKRVALEDFLDVDTHVGKVTGDINACYRYLQQQQMQRRSASMKNIISTMDKSEEAAERVNNMPSLLLQQLQHGLPTLNINLFLTRGVEITYKRKASGCYLSPLIISSNHNSVVIQIERIHVGYNNTNSLYNQHNSNFLSAAGSLYFSLHQLTVIIAAIRKSGLPQKQQSIINIPVIDAVTDIFEPNFSATPFTITKGTTSIGTSFVNTICTIHDMSINIPSANPTFKHFIQLLMKKMQRPTKEEAINSNKTSEAPLSRTMSVMPLIVFAIVFHTVNIVYIANETEQQPASNNNEIQINHFILRLSGEYTSRNRPSNLETWLAQQEYTWLTSSKTMPKTRSYKQHLKRNRNTFARKVLANIMNAGGRVSCRSTYSTKKQVANERIQTNNDEEWSYELSTKLTLGRLRIGQAGNSGTAAITQFIQVKRASIKATTAIDTLFTSQNLASNKAQRVAFSLTSNSKKPMEIHIEAYVYKPIITVVDMLPFNENWCRRWEGNGWIKLILAATQFIHVQNTTETSTATTAEVSSNAFKRKNLQLGSCHLDIIQPGLNIYCTDNGKKYAAKKNSHDYIGNSPKNPIYARISVNLKKFTMTKEKYHRITDGQQAFNHIRLFVDDLNVHQSSLTASTTAAHIIDDLGEKSAQHLILSIPQLAFRKPFDQKSKSFQPVSTADIKGVVVSYSIRNHYICLLLFQSLQDLKYELTPVIHGEQISDEPISNSKKSKLKLITYIDKIDVRINLPFERILHLQLKQLKWTNHQQVAIAKLHKGMSAYSTIDEVASCHIECETILLLVQSARHASKWEQFIWIDQAVMSRFTDTGITVSANKREAEIANRLEIVRISISIPYQFLLCEIIESVITNIKAIKVLHSRQLKNNSYIYLGPSMNNTPVALPLIHLKADIFEIQFDDDPFESNLRQIFKVGLIEQQKRSSPAHDNNQFSSTTTTAPTDYEGSRWFKHKQPQSANSIKSDQRSFHTVFQTPITKEKGTAIVENTSETDIERLSTVDELLPDDVKDKIMDYSTTFDSSDCIAVYNMREVNERSGVSDTYCSTSSSDISEDDIFIRAENAQISLHKFFSKRWIKNMNGVKQREEAQSLRERNINEQRLLSISALNSYQQAGTIRSVQQSITCLDILPWSTQTALAHFRCENTNISIRPPETFGRHQTRAFIHSIGKGVPFETDYSILIPFHLSIKAGTTLIKVRDYPLPFLSVPVPSTLSQSNAENKSYAWNLEGDYVAADERGSSKGSRIITVPLISSASCSSSDEKDVDNGYCLSILFKMFYVSLAH